MNEYIKIAASDGSGEFNAYVATPAKPNGAAIVLIQEIFGLNENIKLTAKYFAEQGYTVYAPDIFWRIEPGVDLDSQTESGREKAMALMAKLDKLLALKDCITTMDVLRQEHSKVGVVGYCLGGRLTYHMACNSNVDCAVAYYGVGIETVLEQADNLTTPLTINIPELDHMCPPEARAAIYEALDSKSNVNLHTYDGVGHAFARYNGSMYNEAAATLANQRAVDFLAKHLS
ncbi:MAG: dienelactone hydrolase family protein [Colwellia sp.]|nr:dienelactone hydrolase family protein [Colwellia sp.]MCW8863711.1 dienelactone hydrolase family protein [Colwellia sp.]MCW9081350.1 dienelactone hydrolase family protein [Colwellia sp.]